MLVKRMKSNTVLKVEKLSKQYRLGLVGRKTIKEDVKRIWYKIRGKEDPYAMVGVPNIRASNSLSDYVLALDNINFEVCKGEVLGIIGANGAGKSTLLKILSKITTPSEGIVKFKGRIASLLEVGTGFHAELTGRENIYLNGAILGMNKDEISTKMDEIIEFSGCKGYIDTPVKRYSSGMGVRLGFAVAAFLEPDILIVDEVLAVGDAEFQKKAIGKMKEISQGSANRTVIFVSHNMLSIKKLCTRGIVLNNGQIVFDGNQVDAIEKYYSLSNTKIQSESMDSLNRFGSGEIRIEKITLLNFKFENISELHTGDELNIKFDFVKNKPIDYSKLIISIEIQNVNGNTIFNFINDEMGYSFEKLEFCNEFYMAIPKLLLRPNKYKLRIVISYEDTTTSDFVDVLEDVCYFEIISGDFWNMGNHNRKLDQAIMPSSFFIREK
jgi:lipopolysaccharide transport system ATP-binding protein